jgi:hypothetical protein
MWRDYGVAKLRQIFWIVAGVGGGREGGPTIFGGEFFSFFGKTILGFNILDILKCPNFNFQNTFWNFLKKFFLGIFVKKNIFVSIIIFSLKLL